MLLQALAVFVFALALLVPFRIPFGFLFKPAVLATEGGHLMALGCLLLGLAALALPRPPWLLPLLAVSFAIYLTPVVRAQPVAATLAARVQAAFGPVPPRELPGAAPRPAPFVYRDLFWLLPAVGKAQHFVFRDLPDRKLQIDFYEREDAPAPRPLVVAVHGGSWTGGDRMQLRQMYAYLAARGYAVAAIEYRLAPTHTFPAALEDVLGSLQWLKARATELKIDPGRVAFYGRSAGGHLALLAAYTAKDPAVRGVVSLYGPTDMNWSWKNPSNPLVLNTPVTLGNFLGGTPAEVQDRYDAASPLRFVGPHSPPTLIVHGGRDELVSPEQSRRLDRRLTEVGVPHLLLELPWATHGCEAVLGSPGGQLTTYAVERFLARVLGPA